MTQDQALTDIRFAGYHADGKSFIRLYMEHRVSFTSARKAFDRGNELREAGWQCQCPNCATKK